MRFALLRRLRDWRVLAAILLVIGVATTVIVVQTNDDATTAITEGFTVAPVDPAKDPAQPALDWLAEEDRRQLEEWLDMYGSGYDCNANKTAASVRDLKLCPDYVASVVFDDNGKPEVTKASKGGSIEPITIDAQRIESCGLDESTGKPYNCDDLYLVTWTVNAGYVALGDNELVKDAITGKDAFWTGPWGMGISAGARVVSNKETRAIEVYAGEPTINTSPTPLSDERLALMH